MKIMKDCKGKKIMKDCKGNKLAIGDEVVFVLNKNGSASLETGVITKFYENKNRVNGDECSVGSHAHILSHRVMKLSIK